jgi:hypothetical protein
MLAPAITSTGLVTNWSQMMNIPQSMLLDWARRLDGRGFILNTQEVAKVQREIATYATADEATQKTLQQFFYNREDT